MGNRDTNQIREFGTGLRDHLELHGVRLDVHATAVLTADLFALFAADEERGQVVPLASQPVIIVSSQPVLAPAAVAA
jgi:hypothetical protein